MARNSDIGILVLLLLAVLPMAQALTIIGPGNGSNPVSLNVSTDVASDIFYLIDNETLLQACKDCLGFSTFLELEEGEHTIRIIAFTRDGASTSSVNVSVEGPDYGPEFSDLPNMATQGNFTDEELAEIIRNNNLNPLIIHRLQETGYLGDASKDALQESQSAPPWIVEKIMKFFGYRE